jgi:GMP synthase (glutamine-hydrolysing)
MPAVIAVIHHLERPFTGHAGPALRAAGAELDERFVRRGDPLPRAGEVDAIVSLGGEQSARDVDSDPALRAEAELLRAAVAAGVPVLGVCLGAQMLAAALGGHVRRLERRTIAWAPLSASAAAAGDPVLGELPAGAAGLHFNEDGFEPPPGAAELLARHAGSAEGVRFAPRAWGVQFHPEVDAAALEHWYRDWPEALDAAGVTERDARAADARQLGNQAELSRAIFGGFAAVVAARGARAGAAA